jgi:hypothetical protein
LDFFRLQVAHFREKKVVFRRQCFCTAPDPQVTVNGKPSWKARIVPACQPLTQVSAARPAFPNSALPLPSGNSYNSEVVNRSWKDLCDKLITDTQAALGTEWSRSDDPTSNIATFRNKGRYRMAVVTIARPKSAASAIAISILPGVDTSK